MRVNVTAEQLAACIAANEAALVQHIRECGQSHPPADGAIGLIVANLVALSHVEPTDVGPVPIYQGEMGEIDVGATDKGERVTVKKRVVHGRKEG